MLNTRIRNALAVGLVAVVGATGAACGDSDEGDATTTAAATALSADEFRTQADAACKQFNDFAASVPEPSGVTEVLPYLEKVLPEFQKEVTTLKALAPPAELKPDWDAALAALDEQGSGIARVRDRIKAGEDAQTAITEGDAVIDAAENRADEKARALGLVECAKDPSDSAVTATAATVPAPTAPTTPTVSGTPTAPTTDTPPTGTVSAGQFGQDTITLGTALQSFGTALQEVAAGGASAVQGRSAELRGHLDEIDRVAARMAGYTVDTPALERKRAAIVAASPDVTRLGRDLLDAAEANDTARIAQVATEFTTALQRLSTAAAS